MNTGACAGKGLVCVFLCWMTFAASAAADEVPAPTAPTISLKAIESAGRKASDCTDPTPKKGASGGARKAVEHPSVSQTVYCAPTSMSSESSNTGTGTKEGNEGGKRSKEEQPAPPHLVPPTDQGKDKLAAGDTSFEFTFKDIHIAAKSPDKWIVVVAIVVAIISLIAAVIFIKEKKPEGGTISGLIFAAGIAVASYWVGQWNTSKSCVEEVKTSIEQRGLDALRSDAIASMTRALSEENARLRQELGSMRTELYVIQNTPHPPPSLWVAVSAALAGLALGLLPMGVIGLRKGLAPQEDRYRIPDSREDDDLFSRLRRVLREREFDRVREIIDELDRRRNP